MAQRNKFLFNRVVFDNIDRKASGQRLDTDPNTPYIHSKLLHFSPLSFYLFLFFFFHRNSDDESKIFQVIRIKRNNETATKKRRWKKRREKWKKRTSQPLVVRPSCLIKNVFYSRNVKREEKGKSQWKTGICNATWKWSVFFFPSFFFYRHLNPRSEIYYTVIISCTISIDKSSFNLIPICFDEYWECSN